MKQGDIVKINFEGRKHIGKILEISEQGSRMQVFCVEFVNAKPNRPSVHDNSTRIWRTYLEINAAADAEAMLYKLENS